MSIVAKRKKRLIILIVVIIFLLGLVAADSCFIKIVRIDGKSFLAEIPLSSQAYQKGLGERNDLCLSCAMLFRFHQKDKYAFWMKGMRFNLDIIWIADGKIVYMKKNFPADSAEIFAPNIPTDNVLEINSGLADKYNFKIGDRVHIY